MADDLGSDCTCDGEPPPITKTDSDCSCSINMFKHSHKADTDTLCSCSTHIPDFHDSPKDPSTKTESIGKCCDCSSHTPSYLQIMQESQAEPITKAVSKCCFCGQTGSSLGRSSKGDTITVSSNCTCINKDPFKSLKSESSKTGSTRCTCSSHGVDFGGDVAPEKPIIPGKKYRKCGCPPKEENDDSTKTASTRCTCSSHGVDFGGDVEPEKPIIPGKKYRKCGCPPKEDKDDSTKCGCSSQGADFGGDVEPEKPKIPEQKFRKCGCPAKGSLKSGSSRCGCSQNVSFEDDPSKSPTPKDQKVRKCGCLKKSKSSKSSSSASLLPILDPNCDPDNPKMLTYELIRNARANIEGAVIKTPLTQSKLSDIYGMNIYLKTEFLQYTGSFKERGARNALMNMPENQRSIGAISASAGNHALALCYHGQELGVPVTVVMPVIAPIMKIQNCKEFGAEIIVKGADLGEAKIIAQHLAEDRGALYINGYDHIDVLAGQGTLGIEILEQLPSASVIVVPAGGGGLIAGIAVAVKTLKPCTKVIGVESENCPSFSNSLKAGKPVLTTSLPTVADGLAVPLPGYNAVFTAKNYVDKMIIVKEDDITVAMLRLIEKEKYIVEGAGATVIAAIASGQLDEFKGKNVVAVLSGGNIDSTVLGRVLERGLAADGRFLKVYVTVSDRPGGVTELIRMISSIGVSIKNVSQEREWLIVDVFSVKVKVVCETRDWDHACQLKQLLEQNYDNINMVHVDFPPSTRSGKLEN